MFIRDLLLYLAILAGVGAVISGEVAVAQLAVEMPDIELAMGVGS